MKSRDKIRVRATDTNESQREIMEESLRSGQFECMVCCDPIRVRDRVWNCEHCYNVFHLKCIKAWAQSQTTGQEEAAQTWRCPTCQTHIRRVPNAYYCFCGKLRDPDLNRYIVPHSCGDTCGRKPKPDPNRKYNCPNKCLLRCHPGSCPPCELTVSRQCGCGRTRVTAKCVASDVDVSCHKPCGKQLNCGQHFCELVCHTGPCPECTVKKTQQCFCGQHKKEVDCSVENALIDTYSCGQICGNLLKCGNHKCQKTCHFGDCDTCPMVPEEVTHCPCGKTPLKELTSVERKSCLDPIATCDSVCDKELNCGPEEERHRCARKCHNGQCGPCDQKTVIRCRCGRNNEYVDCAQLVRPEDRTFACKRRCSKKLSCNRHKCMNECCVNTEHLCQQVCGKRLSCGQHTCQETCHTGACHQCWNVSWDELTCHCGASVKLPPIACGTEPPECGLKCSRMHSCDHPVDHTCHNSECPPCTYLTPKACYGGHQSRAIPCHQASYSCGYACGKPLDCGLHTCQSICHPGQCGECKLPCNKVREDCGHPCGLECHQLTAEVCPKSKCKAKVKVYCECGRKTDVFECHKVMDGNAQRVSLNTLANMRIKNGESVDVREIMRSLEDYKHIQLKCDDKCAVIERNRQLAEALDIKDADFSPDPGPPRYSDLLKNTARTDPAFIKDIYDKLTRLVLESRQTKLAFKHLNLPPMNSELRHVVHELAEHFGCKTHAVDQGVNRSVVVKADKGKCYLPTISVMDLVKEEDQQRKGITTTKPKITLKNHCFDSGADSTGLGLLPVNTGISMIRNISTDSTDSSNKPAIDYFDFKGD
jgi:transcriptional repressor NF-X1